MQDFFFFEFLASGVSQKSFWKNSLQQKYFTKNNLLMHDVPRMARHTYEILQHLMLGFKSVYDENVTLPVCKCQNISRFTTSFYDDNRNWIFFLQLC